MPFSAVIDSSFDQSSAARTSETPGLKKPLKLPFSGFFGILLVLSRRRTA
jgi:hypothetical protein